MRKESESGDDIEEDIDNKLSGRNNNDTYANEMNLWEYIRKKFENIE